MGVSVAFNYDQWVARYPEFAGSVNSTQAGELFAEATIYHRNDGGGPVRNAAAQTVFLNMMVAHLAQLYFGTSANPASANDPVGRVTTAGQGSVSAGFDTGVPPGTAAWFDQTKYGFAYWRATAIFRTMRYIPGHPRPVSPFPFR
jgi:hypothetical protein